MIIEFIPILTILIGYRLIVKIHSNNILLKKLKVYILIVAIVRIFRVMVQFIIIFLLYRENMDAFKFINELISILSDYIFLPLSIIGVLILLYGLINIKERGDIND